MIGIWRENFFPIIISLGIKSGGGTTLLLFLSLRVSPPFFLSAADSRGNGATKWWLWGQIKFGVRAARGENFILLPEAGAQNKRERRVVTR